MTPYLHPVPNGAHFHWNLNCSVGKGGSNNLPCDVAYIQWYYTLAARHPETPPDRQAIYSRVQVTGACRGTADDPLVQAIVAHQTRLNHPRVDGRINVAHGSGKVSDSAAFFIIRLGARFANMHPGHWPRLDHIPGCPPLVALAVREALPRV
jgi:hypothetical protein